MLKRAGAFTAPEKTHEHGWEPIHFIAHFGASTHGYPAIPPPKESAAFCTQGSVAYQHSKIPPSCTRLDLSLENAGDG